MMLETLSWASNMNNQVAFGEQALNDQRIYPVGELVGVLKLLILRALCFGYSPG